MITISGVVFDFDPLCADDLEKFENEAEKMQNEAAIIDQNFADGNQKPSQYIRETCQSVLGFFDRVFGEGASKKIFPGKVGMNDCLDMAEEVMKQITGIVSKTGERINKFSPDRLKRRPR